MKMLQSGIVLDRDVRSMSFTTTMQMLASTWVCYAMVGVMKPISDWAIHSSGRETVGIVPDGLRRERTNDGPN